MRPASDRILSWERFLKSNNYILDPEDTISRLPQDVINHIISFIPSGDVKKLRLISRKWRLIYSQTQTDLQFCRCRLDEQQLMTIFQDYFPSTECFALVKCPRIRNLKVVSNKLKNVTMIKCANLEKVELTAPNLKGFGFRGSSIHKPCIVEFGVTSQLTHLQLAGVYINETMFSDCDTTFPVLTYMTLSGSYHMSNSINISSRSLKSVAFFEFKKPVDISIDAPELVNVMYRGHVVANFLNTNLPSVKRAKIELKSGTNHEPNSLWYQKLVGMLQAFKPSELLALQTNVDQSVIIPEELRRTLVPPIRGPKSVMLKIYNLPTNVVDLIDTMLWISPRAECLSIIRERVIRYVWLKHGEIWEALLSHSCCTSYPVRCWRHSLVECRVDRLDENWGKDIAYYFKENLAKLGRNAVQEILLP